MEQWEIYDWKVWNLLCALTFESTLNLCWKCEHEGKFYYVWWTYKKAKLFFDTNTYINSEALKIKIPDFAFETKGQAIRKNHETLFLYMTTTTRWVYAQKWKSLLSMMEEWLVNLMEFAEMVKLISFDRKRHYLHLWSNENPLLTICGQMHLWLVVLMAGKSG